MIKRKPSILTTKDISVNEAQPSVLICMRVDDDILDFTGHFPNHPLLPGVTQVDWAIHYAKQYLNVHSNFKGMEVLKFQEPILPNMEVELELKWDIEKSKLYFTYRSNKGDTVSNHASGRIVLGA
ncbi:3-hydroxyacyl-ACP dehydratase [Aliivibrio fischeri]|uniref:3-hydroxyacyl-ACP dehydratase n=1 Tax=Aliivibrio fischeri TaxID=668 RepID=A0A6N3YZ35_ALIFS|nr:3-hydroxyacyl-ACP dehydratase [Aliivibrio fischeri]MUK41860.1 3-hydroxyacyl-ACP dehydratase [Aliivibrio fischeri]MUK45966.1 3-hydroxyacyl-ACP dehydratase [Aliivibrio fischeri]MUK77525.1 3-hydroxyacyl-ACP dehydratase [Aliivibrio fischeri]MUK79653.1 3-hydroxyacyl-ACP dehydratase [Aliivibrio fischeri]MUK83383.1 3-hydroxyacyl-ACP dehydratase [Aliivibrio fischeri]